MGTSIRPLDQVIIYLKQGAKVVMMGVQRRFRYVPMSPCFRTHRCDRSLLEH